MYMRISFTIEIDDTQSVKVQSADVKVQEDVKGKGEKKKGEKITREWIGEGGPR